MFLLLVTEYTYNILGNITDAEHVFPYDAGGWCGYIFVCGACNKEADLLFQ
jgi:hypothetical protein